VNGPYSDNDKKPYCTDIFINRRYIYLEVAFFYENMTSTQKLIKNSRKGGITMIKQPETLSMK